MVANYLCIWSVKDFLWRQSLDLPNFFSKILLMKIFIKAHIFQKYFRIKAMQKIVYIAVYQSV